MTCVDCGEEKAVEEFSFWTYKRKDGSRSRKKKCKTCEVQYSSRYRKENPDRVLVSARRWREENRFRAAINTSRHDAKKRGHEPCDATHEELEAAFTGKCHGYGISEEECVRKLYLDHDHVTRKFRGWLCPSCNVRRDVLAATKISEEGMAVMTN